MKRKATTENEKHTIPAVMKTLELVQVLAEGEEETTTKALSIRLQVPRTTCYRILRSLVAKDWVRPLQDGRHALSFGLLPLVRPLQRVEQVGKAVGLALEQLATQAQMTAKVSMREGDYAVTIARCESPQQTSVAMRLGASFHLVMGSSGAVLLSALEPAEVQLILKRAPKGCWELQKPAEVQNRLKMLRSKGWCADLGTYHRGVHAVSAPLHDVGGGVLASMTVIGFPHELPPERLPSVAKLLLEAACRAEAAIHGSSVRTLLSKATRS